MKGLDVWSIIGLSISALLHVHGDTRPVLSFLLFGLDMHTDMSKRLITGFLTGHSAFRDSVFSADACACA